MSKIDFRDLKLKSHEEFLICRTYVFCLVKDLILKCKVDKGERNNKGFNEQSYLEVFIGSMLTDIVNKDL